MLLGRRQRHPLSRFLAGGLFHVDAELVAVGELEGLDVLERGPEVEDKELVVCFGGGAEREKVEVERERERLDRLEKTSRRGCC